MLTALLRTLFPLTSLTGADGDIITPKERAAIERSLRPIRMGKELLARRGIHGMDALVAASGYEQNPLLRQAILRLKYGRIECVHRDLGGWMVTSGTPLVLRPANLGNKAPVLCPVPLHWTRQYWRGFNQASLLAEEIGHRTGWDVTELLRRTRPTGHQARRSRPERLQALTGAFTYIGQAPPPWVVLIDDICTTGATLMACASALRHAGVQHVTALVAAHGSCDT